MNIKRRLYVSNLLMWLIPVTVSVAVYFGGMRVFAAISGVGAREREGRHYVEAIYEANDLMDEWSGEGADISKMTEDVTKFNERYAENGQIIALYRKGRPVDEAPVNETPIKPDETAVSKILSREDDSALFGRATARARTIGDYRAVFYEDLLYVDMGVMRSYRSVMMRGMAAAFVCTAVMILLTNVFLTRFVFKKILRALDTLTHGVRQIRDGNLDYRIEYGERDEFSSVCGDFNQMAKRLLDAREARERDERSRRELIAGISHDLRTPLTSIKAYVEGLEQGVAATRDARARYVDTIKNKAGDLEHIIEKLFLFSKLDTEGFPYREERVDLGAVVAEIVSGVAEEYRERGLDISVAVPGEPVFVNIDAAQTRYALINIFENSLKYKVKDRGRARAEVTRDGGSALLEMSDDGPGVPDDALPKLFGLFYRLDGSRSNPSGGSGLGLAIASKIVAHFGGGIEAKNAPSGGLKLEIRLPVAEEVDSHA